MNVRRDREKFISAREARKNCKHSPARQDRSQQNSPNSRPIFCVARSRPFSIAVTRARPFAPSRFPCRPRQKEEIIVRQADSSIAGVPVEDNTYHALSTIDPGQWNFACPPLDALAFLPMSMDLRRRFFFTPSRLAMRPIPCPSRGIPVQDILSVVAIRVPIWPGLLVNECRRRNRMTAMVGLR